MAVLLNNKRKYLVIIVSLIFISSLFFSFSTQSKVESSTNEGIICRPIITNWWNASWQYSTQVEIENDNSQLTNYSVLVTIPFYFEYENASDIGADIRFTYQDNTTLLNHWIEERDMTYASVFREKRWVSKSTKKRLAYPTKAEAQASFIARKRRQIKILTNQLECAKEVLFQAELGKFLN